MELHDGADPARWQVVQDLFHLASELDPACREAFLRSSSADEESLSQVRDLLSADEVADSALSQVVAAAARAATTPAQIGPYRITRQLGAGGMGTVFLAERDDDQYHKQVAIKLVRAGLDAPAFERRFRSERQILAHLEHPWICRLLDGGATPWGAPYLVMEYVEGVSITDYCRDHNLPIRDRVRLFRRVCEAVSYAHRNLVIHRDLKPANILINGEGAPRLLDFGIAKVVEEQPTSDIALTRMTERMMTPEYASPEQIRGEPITTGTDVYSLGLILYEILTGTKAWSFDGMTPSQIERAITEQLPTRPSTAAAGVGAPIAVRKALAGDLDNIVLMAVRKDAARRYPSVDAMSEDLRRYLEGYPVAARGEKWTYIFSRFVGRHRVPVFAAGTITVGLIAALAVTRAAETRAEAAHRVAQNSFRQALAIGNSSLFEVNDALAGLPGSIRARELLVNSTLAHLGALSRLSADNPAVQKELATAYERLADIQYRDGVGHLGDSSGALASAWKALALRKTLSASDPSEFAAIAADYQRIGNIQRLTRDLQGAATNFRQALAFDRRVPASGVADRALEERVAEIDTDLGDVNRLRGDLSGSANLLHAAIQTWQRLRREFPTDAEARHGFIDASIALGDLRTQTGDPKGAAAMLTTVLPDARAQVASQPKSTEYRTQLASVLNRLGNAWETANDPGAALPSYLESESIIHELARENPDDARLRRSVQIHSTNVALVLLQTGKLEEAESRFRESCSVYAAMVAADPNSSLARHDLAYATAELGKVLTAEGKLGPAERQLDRALQMRLRLCREDPANVVYSERLARIYEEMGDVAAKRRDWPAAVAQYRTAQATLAMLRGKFDVGSSLERVENRIAMASRSGN